MQSRRLHRLSRFRRNKRRLRDRLRQRIFFREDRMKPEAMAKPRVVVLTGAGISAESGIKTFRAADGLWEEHRVEDVATPEGFARDPALVQAFYNARRRQLQSPEIAPNAAHLALARLEDLLGDHFLLVTQNIDNLHERAGNRRVIHMHGELLKVRCSWSGQVLEWTGDVTAEDKCHCCQFPAALRPTWSGLAKCRWGWMRSTARWPKRISLSPSAPPATFIRRPALCTRRGCTAPIPLN
jgi:NAD-dependent deacetylase